MAFAIASNPITNDSLIDIRDVKVDKTLPKPERITSFIRQIKNPYHFRCGEFVITTRFSEGGQTLEQCLQGILR